MKSFFEKTIRFLIPLTFVVPFFFGPFVWKSFIFPFIVPKIVLFRSLTMLMVAAYVCLLGINYQKYKLKFTPLTLALLGFYLSFALSTFVGVDWYKSFWDNHERMLGLFTMTHYVVYYIVVTSIGLTKEEWKTNFRWILWLGSIVMILGIVQKFSPDFMLNQGNTRVSSTLGNPIYFAGYGLFLGCLGLYLYVCEKDRTLKITSLLLGFLGLSATFLSGTRGTLLGIAVGVAVSLLLIAFHRSLAQKTKYVVLSVFLGAVIVVSCLFLLRHNTIVNQIPALGKLLNSASEIHEKSPRLMSWGIAIESWKEKPIFGWGPNNYYYAFNKYYRPEYLNFGWGETWFDNAHNVVLNTLAVQGLLGLVSYLSLFAVGVVYLIKKEKEGTVDIRVMIFGVGFLVAHFVHNVFVFEDPTSLLYFYFFLAYINVQLFETVAEKNKVSDTKFSVYKASAVFFIIFLFIHRTNIDVAKANVRSFEAIQSVYTGVDTLNKYNIAVNTPTPHIDDVRADIARAVYAALPNYAQANRLEGFRPIFNASYEDLKKDHALHPLDIRIHLQEAQLAQAGAQYYQRPELYQEAEVVLDEALTHSPKRQQVQYTLAMLSFQLQKPQKAEALLVDAIKNTPKFAEGWWRLAYVYIYSGRPDQAQKIMQQAQQSGVVFEPSRLQNIETLIRQATVSSTAPKSK